MSHPIKKVLYSLTAAVLTAAAAGLFCLFARKPEENGRAVIFFTEASPQSSVVDTEISRSVSALRRAVEDEKLLERAAVGSGVTADRIKDAVSVSRLGNSSGAEIILCGMDDPAEAPIILMNILYLAESSSEIPPFEIISGFDLPNAPSLPFLNIAAGAGLAGGLVCYLAMSSLFGGRKHSYHTKKADRENDYQSALFMQNYIDDACKSALDLGELPLAAPEGLEKSGYTAAADKLAEASEKASSKLITIASDSHRTSEDIPPAAKITSYLACALAEKGKRTVIIDCMINSPAVYKIFKAAPAGSLAGFVKGECAVWDIISVNARKGVDIISHEKKKGDMSPAEVFSSPEYARLLEYLAPQYDYILLCAARAWDCSEWGHITQGCKGYVIVLGGDSVGANIAKEILGQKSGFAALCRVKKPVSEESAADTRKDEKI
ncbi:MAG: hypothetical protein MSJ26_02090 [Oscillospiraceae bacterium]|nr:hypothetical protein [Oscillospiraceae bacterium]